MTATARQKCLDVYATATDPSSIPTASSSSKQPQPHRDPDVVIAADTVIVTRDGSVLEKPRSPAHHAHMLRSLRDQGSHRVVTAVCVAAPRADARHPGYAVAEGLEETTVYFAGGGGGEGDGGEGGQASGGELGNDVIDAYVRTREGADKAGGYAVQGVGGLVLVERIDGCVDNVVGLPVRKTLALVEKAVWRQDEGSGSEGSEGDDGED